MQVPSTAPLCAKPRLGYAATNVRLGGPRRTPPGSLLA